MTPKKLPIVRQCGRALVVLSFLSLIILAIYLLFQIVPSWQPGWSMTTTSYHSVYRDPTFNVAQQLPMMLFTWLSITAMAVGIRVMGLWPARANLVRG